MIVLRGVRIVGSAATERDGDDRLSAPHDVTVQGGRITAITPSSAITSSASSDLGSPDDATRSDLTGADATVIDADGRLVLPGLVDAHVHGEAAIFDPDVQVAMLRQGVTTIVVGQDGVSYAPSTASPTAAGVPDPFAWASAYFAAINGEHPTFRGGSVEDLLAGYAGAVPLNIAYLIPHGTLRYGVLGGQQRPATAAEVATMARALDVALDQGGCGLSTGLEYAPSAYADHSELTALARVAARRGLPHVSHMRGYEDRAGPAFAELVAIARDSGVATHVSHYHGPSAELLGYVDRAADEGLDVSFDSYPYLRGCSILSMVTLPSWLPLAEPERALAQLADPGVRRRLHAEHLVGLDHLWDRITLASVPGALSWAEGLRLPDVAARLGLGPAQAAIELLVSTRLQASCIFEQPPTNSPESVREMLRHPAHLGGSDAIYAGGRPHPRGWGAFSRFLAVHVRELGDWTWSDAVEHLSTAAARRFGLTGRGSVEVGAVADLVLVDPDTVADRATYEDPRRTATGIDDVLVAGVPVLSGGRPTGRTPGGPLRPGPLRPGPLRPGPLRPGPLRPGPLRPGPGVRR